MSSWLILNGLGKKISRWAFRSAQGQFWNVPADSERNRTKLPTVIQPITFNTT